MSEEFYSSGRTYGVQPSPRVLVVSPSEDALKALRPVLDAIPTVRVTTHASNENRDLREPEWDAVIAFHSVFSDMNGTRQIVFANTGSIGAYSMGTHPMNRQTMHSMVELARLSLGAELFVPEELSAPIRQAVTSNLLPIFSSTERRQCLELSGRGPLHLPDEMVTPFLTDRDRCAIAGILHHSRRADVWFLPEEADLARWVRLAFDSWSASDPASYSLRDSWRSSVRWMTSDEAAAARDRERLEVERREFDDYLQRRTLELDQQASIASQSATDGPGRLLVSQDDALVEAVVESLAFFGFEVILKDLVNAPKGAKLEDLEVKLAGWVALAEVRGYKGGAKTDDLMRIGGFVRRHLEDTGSVPDSSWYIVNQFINDPPDSRPSALSGRPAELEVFAEQQGSVVDTRDLFQIRCDVEAGALTKQEAVDLLRANSGLLYYTPRRPLDL